MIVRAGSDRTDSPFLTTNKEYVVIGLDDTFFRAITDRGEPVLIPRSKFEIVDESIPAHWIWTCFADDKFYADPPELSARGFYERYFDHDQQAVETLHAYLRKERIIVQ